MKNKKISIILNTLIIILEIIGFIVTLRVNHKISYEYYTEDSNIIALITSLIFVIFIITKNKIPKWLSILKYASTICLFLTFIVVLFILAPMYDFNYRYLLLYNSMFYQHLLCPILSIITFIFFDNIGKLTIKDSFIGISLTFIYAIILIILNYFELIIGPYPFLKINEQSIIMSIFWFILIFGLTYFISFILRKLYLKFNVNKP